MSKKDETPQTNTLVSVQFRFEHRDSQRRLIATNKNLKKKASIKEWLTRLLHFARV